MYEGLGDCLSSERYPDVVGMLADLYFKSESEIAAMKDAMEKAKESLQQSKEEAERARIAAEARAKSKKSKKND